MTKKMEAAEIPSFEKNKGRGHQRTFRTTETSTKKKKDTKRTDKISWDTS